MDQKLTSQNPPSPPLKKGGINEGGIRNVGKAALILATLALLGCSPDREQAAQCPLVPVSGQVTLNGQPCADAKVLFVPLRLNDANCTNLPPSMAVTDQQGRFQLRASGAFGAVAGRHRVWIRTAQKETHDLPPAPPGFGAESSSDDIRPEQIPARFHTETELVFEVSPGGAEDAIFELASEE